MRFNINNFELDPDVVPLDPVDATWYSAEETYPVTAKVVFQTEPRFQQLIAWCKEQGWLEVELSLELQPQQGLYRVVEQRKLKALVAAMEALGLS